MGLVAGTEGGMSIDGYSMLHQFNTKLLTKNIQPAELTIFDDWLRQAKNPLYFGAQRKYKKIKLEMLIMGDDDNDCHYNMSSLSRALTKCTIKFDDLDFTYKCTLASTDTSSLVEHGYFGMTVELNSEYAMSAEVTEVMSHVASKSLESSGTLAAPIRLTVVTPINTASLTINGFGRSMIVKNIVANVPIVINGEDCTVTSNSLNKFADVEMWAFPELQPGANLITVSDSNCVLTVTHSPRFI